MSEQNQTVVISNDRLKELAVKFLQFGESQGLSVLELYCVLTHIQEGLRKILGIREISRGEFNGATGGLKN